jgi:hypothetical protein
LHQVPKAIHNVDNRKLGHVVALAPHIAAEAVVHTGVEELVGKDKVAGTVEVVVAELVVFLRTGVSVSLLRWQRCSLHLCVQT